MTTSASLRDPATGQTVFIVGISGHEVEVKHRPRVPVLDVPGKQGDVVQSLGRKSRRAQVRKGLVNPALIPGVVGGFGIGVGNGNPVPFTFTATGSLSVPQPIAASEAPTASGSALVQASTVKTFAPSTTGTLQLSSPQTPSMQPVATPTVTVT